MKIGQFFKNLASGSVILAALACPVFNSCADFGAELEDMKGDIADLENRVTALEERLNTDLTALQALLEGKIEALDGRVDGIEGDLTDLIATVDGLVTVKDTKKNSDGSLDITLTDGTKFTVYPEYEADYSGIVTTTEIEGVLYWAIFDENGKAVAVTDEDGMPVPVVEAVPQVKNEDGLFYVSFDGGETWEPTGVADPCVFADAEVVYSEPASMWEDPMPMYVVLTLADGNTITVTLDGAAQFFFGERLGGPIEAQYVQAGGTSSVSIQAVNVIDWIKEVPNGWTVEEGEYYGSPVFNVTAPTAEAILSGAAVAEGDLKVLAVAEGGKSLAATLKLTTKAFSSLSASKGNLNVGMNNGVGGYLVGVSTLEDYNPEAIVAELEKVIEEDKYVYWEGGESSSWSPWYPELSATIWDDNYFSYSLEEAPIADLVSSVELVEGECYVIWAVALNMWYDDYDSGYTVGDVYSTEYLHAFIKLDETKTVVSFNDIQLSIEFAGVDTFFGFFADGSYSLPTSEDILDRIEGYIQSDMYFTVDWEGGLYEGSPADLVDSYYTIEPDTKYYLWLVPRVEGKTKYSASDVYYYEWTTEGLVAGGKTPVTVDEEAVVADFQTVSIPLEAEEAAYIFYSFVDPSMVSTLGDLQTYLLESGFREAGSSIIATKYNMTPGSTITLIAMAIDKYGCYGEVYQKDFSAKAMEFASVTVSAELVGKASSTTTVKVAASGEVASYYYWFDMKDDYVWYNIFGGSAESASSYIALTPESWYLTKVAADALPADGIVLEELAPGVQYVFVVAAQLADGSFTKAAVLDIEPQLDFGEFVYATDDNGNENPVWAAAKPKVEYVVETVGDFNIVDWTVEVPEGFTGKTISMHPENLLSHPTAKDKATYMLTDPYICSFDLVEGETYSDPYVSKGYKIYVVIFDADGNCYEPYVYDIEGLGGWGV